jgi:hypothetical protein
MLRKSWTDDEDEALKKALAAGVSVQRLAIRLKRPQGAIRQRAATLGLEIKPLQRLPISEVQPDSRPRKRRSRGEPSTSENNSEVR